MVEILISLDPKLVDCVSPHILKLVHYILRKERNPEGIFEIVRLISILFIGIIFKITPGFPFQSAIVEPDNYHALSGALEEHAKNRFCIEIIGPAQRLSSCRLAKKPTTALGPASSLGVAAESIPEVREGHSPDIIPPEQEDQLVQTESNKLDTDNKCEATPKTTQQLNTNKRRRHKKKSVDYADDANVE